MTTTTTTTTTATRVERRPWRPELTRRLALVLGASALLAFVAGGRGADALGDELGGALGRWAASPRRHTVEHVGLPRVEDDHGLTPGAPAAPALGGPSARVAAPSAAPAAGIRTRGVHVPAAVVLAYARRGVVPAVDTRDGVRLRGVGTGAGLADGDTLVSVGSARVRSLREVSGIVTSAVLAGRTELSGIVRRGDDDIAVTVEIPTGAEAPAN
jgi:membrane-associated protease RseP (regulator of RpoE activity)